MSFLFQDLNIISNPALYKPWTSYSFPRNRLVVWFTYWADAQVYQQNPVGWRTTSMTIHLVISLLLASFSVWAGLLFLVHPLTVMGHSYVAGRSGQLQTLLQLIAAAAVVSHHLVIALFAASVASYYAKEDSVILFPMIVVLWLTTN